MTFDTLLNGAFRLSGWGYVWVALGLTHVTIASVTIYLHRCQAHRALELHPIASHFFRFWLWFTTGMVTREWVSVHRKHHAKVETEEDPHSPQVHGIKQILWHGLHYYRVGTRNKETLERYGHATPDDWLERNLYTPHNGKGYWGMLAIELACFGWHALPIWGVQLLWIPLWAAGVINGIGHYWGYRNYETQDAATNIVPWGILIGGEELHNNHHAYSASAKLSSKWYEFDIGWLYIRMLSVLGLAKVKRSMPELPDAAACLSRHQNAVDVAKVLVRHRLHVIEQYCQNVISPVVSDMKSSMNELSSTERMSQSWKRVKALLVSDQGILSSKASAQLSTLLSENQQLKEVYELRNHLLNICQLKGVKQSELVQAFSSWCDSAEATGIESLREFASWLRTYLPTAQQEAVAS